VRLQIIRLAEEVGDHTTLRNYLRVFVQEHPRDNRTHFMRLRLAALEGAAP
jgi:hypothetical protein